MPLFTVRRTKVLRITSSTAFEVEAVNKAVAEIKAACQPDGDLLWIEDDERETIATHTSICQEGEGP
jgi:hypothetical protein